MSDGPAPSAHARPVRVALFITCFNDLLFPQVGEATVHVLERLGVEVEFPAEQTCCGQMHFNTGYREQALPMVRRFVQQFEAYDRVVTPSASCAAMIRFHHPVLAADSGDVELQARVAALVPRVRELTELLVDDLGVTDVGARFEGVVALHPTCHSLRLLDDVDGLRLVELPGDDECCGFGGTFAIKNADVSVAMGQDKLDAVAASGAEVLTATDTSCLLHLGGMLARASSPTRVMHLAEILAGEPPR